MTIIRKLVTRWGFDVDAKPLDDVEASVKSLKTGLKVVAGLAGAGAVALYGLVRSIANAGDEAVKAADRLGINVEALQELRYAADLAGMSKNELDNNLKKGNRSARDAAEGTKAAAEAYELFGVEVEHADGKLKNAEELLMELASAYNDVEDEGRRAAAMQDIYGRSGDKMGNLLGQGAEGVAAARAQISEYGTISEETARQSEELNDTITRMRAFFRGISIQLASDLIPQALELAQGFHAVLTEARPLIQMRLEQTIDLISRGLSTLWAIIRTVIFFVTRLVEVFGGLERVIKVVGLLLATFVTFKIIMGIQALIAIIGALATAFASSGAAAMLAQAKMLLMPVLIAALIVLVGVLADDFRAFFNGQDSAIGELLKKYPVLGATILTIADVFVEILKAVRDFFSFLFTGTSEWDNAFSELGESIGDYIFDAVQDIKAQWAELKTNTAELVDNIVGSFRAGVDLIIGFFTNLGEKAAEAIGGIPGISQAFEAGQALGGSLGAAAEFVGVGGRGGNNAPTDAVGARRRQGGGQQNTFNGGDMNITQLPGESGEDFAARVQRLQQEQWDRQMRSASDDLATGAIY